MTLDDDSLLSAYLDGQLSPDQQQLVESASVSDPHVAETLRNLTLVRDLLAGLSREAAVDVTAPVLARIHRQLRLRTVLAAALHPALASSRRARVAGVLGMAALLLIAITVPILMRHLPAPQGTAGSPHPATAARAGSP